MTINHLPAFPFAKGGMIIPPFARGSLGGILRSHLLALVGATLRGRPSAVRFPNPGVPAYRQAGTGTPLHNSRGISVLFLIIALLLMVMVGYVLSYLIPTKQKSVQFPIYSTQAHFIAQSGLEYGVRFCSDQGWRGATDTGRLDYDRLNDSGVNQRNIVIGKVNGKFTISYTVATSTLTSTGELNNSTEKRIVTISNFPQFLRLTFTSSPCWISGYLNQRVEFNIVRWRSTGVSLSAFSSTWQEDTSPATNITTIRFGNTTRFSGTYASGSGIRNFTGGNELIGTAPTRVQVYWNSSMTNPRNIVITFYTPAGATTNEGYKFNLDPAGNNLPGC